MKKLLLPLLLFSSYLSIAQTDAAWLRYPAISPDGKTIAFGYKGDIYTVPSAGGVAIPITMHDAHDMMPVWSHDGQKIAFASDRFGNFDVYVMPIAGGEPTRITYNSAPDYPTDFSIDNKQVLFTSARMAPANSIRFYSPRLFQNLYQVSVLGGKAKLISAAGMDIARLNSTGSQLVFQDRKGYEDALRKHHTSAVTRDIWLMDTKTQAYRQLSGFEGEDREPVFSPDDQFVYYLSEKKGTQNIFKTPVLNRMAEQQLTQFTTHPVRHLSVSNTNTLCFTYNGHIYTLSNGATPQKLVVTIKNDGRGNTVKNVPVRGGVSEFEVSPNGKEVAFINRGEVFVTAVEGGTTKRITNTPRQERMLAWSSDGKTLYYSAENDTSWDIMQATMVRKVEPYFYASTLIKEEPVIATAAEEFQPVVSPDGKEIAYLENRNIIKVFNLATKKSRTILPKGRNYSYSDGDQYFEWSPDSKWLVVQDQQGTWQYANAALIKADGSQTIFPVKSGFGESGAKFSQKGKMMTWVSNRDGLNGAASQGGAEMDVFAVFFDQEAFDEFTMDKEAYALLKEIAKKDTTKAKKDSIAEKNWTPDFNNLDNRRLKLTINSTNMSDYVLNPDGSKLYYMAAYDKGYDLWTTDTRTKETKVLAKLGGSPTGIEMSKDGKTLYVTNNGSLVKIDESGKPTPIAISGDMQLDEAAERAYILNHAFKQVRSQFYDPTIHGINWKGFYENYAAMLPYINNNYDFQELLSEFLGELNASHTGGRYSPRPANADATPSLGIITDETYTGAGLLVSEILAGGPLDKADNNIKPGDIIEKIDGEDITVNTDPAMLLNRKAGNTVLLSIYRTADKKRWEQTLKPISMGAENGLMYRRWVKKMEQITDSLSNGRVGYVHVQGMNDGSFREVLDKTMGKNLGKEALIVDTRFNGGGWLHDDLNTFLSGKKYLEFAPQGNKVNMSEPAMRWSKPSCVIMSEGNYSDAFIFPYVYKQNGIGKLIGMPVAGTGTAVWWETQIDPTIVFGIPMVATIGAEGRPTENLQVEPDIKVPLPYTDFLKGKDTQLEAAVKHMLQTIGNK